MCTYWCCILGWGKKRTDSIDAGKAIATGYANGTVRLWEVETGKPLDGFEKLIVADHNTPIDSLSWIEESADKPTGEYHDRKEELLSLGKNKPGSWYAATTPFALFTSYSANTIAWGMSYIFYSLPIALDSSPFCMSNILLLLIHF